MIREYDVRVELLQGVVTRKVVSARDENDAEQRISDAYESRGRLHWVYSIEAFPR